MPDLISGFSFQETVRWLPVDGQENDITFYNFAWEYIYYAMYTWFVMSMSLK